MSKRHYTTRLTMGLVATASLLAMTVAPAASVFAASPTPTASRIGGVDRMATAIDIANQQYPNGPSSGTVVIASGANANLIDSVTAAPLAQALGAPILLSQSATNLSSETTAYLTSNNITKVVLVGAAANSTLKSELPSSVTSVQEISGATRYQTAAAIASQLKTIEGANFGGVFVANGRDSYMAEALAAAPFAAKMKEPILLANGTSSLPSSEAGFVQNGSSQNLYLIGGAQGNGLSSTYSSDTVVKIGSSSNSHYANAVAVAQHFAPSSGYSTIDVANDSNTETVSANGTVSYHLVDAITGAPLAASEGAAIVFTNGSTITPSVQSFLGSQTNVANLNVFGGTASIPSSTKASIAGDLGNAATSTSTPSVSNITVSGQSFGNGSSTSPAVTTNGSAMTVSASLTSATGNPITGVDLTLDVAVGANQSTPTVTSNGTTLTPTSITFNGGPGDSYNVPTNSSGTAAAKISIPSGVGATYTVQYKAPYTVDGSSVTDNKAYVEFVTSTTMGISPVGTSTSPFNAAVSSVSNESTGLVPVTVTLPPINGSQPQNVQVTFTLSENGNTAPYLSNSQGGTVGTSNTATVNTDSNGQATIFVDSNSTTSTPVEVSAQATDQSGTLSNSTYVSWGESGVPQKVKSSTLTAAGVTNNLNNIGVGNTGNGFSTAIPFYTANVNNQVTVSGEVEDAVGNPVPNASLIVVASSTQQVNDTNYYVSGSTKTAFPAVGTYNTSITSTSGGGDTAISGQPNASSSYGEEITANSNGYFSYTVENTLATGTVTQTTASDSINQYEVYGIQNGEISTALTNGTVQVDWQNGQQLSEIAVGPTSSLNYHDKSMGTTQIAAAASPPMSVPGPTLFFKGLAGSASYAGSGQSATYNINVNNTGNVAAIDFTGPNGTQYEYLINPTSGQSGTTPLASSPAPVNATAGSTTIANGAGAVSVAVTPTGTANEYSLTINGVQVAGSGLTVPYITSSSIGVAVQDSNSNTDTVTIQSGNISNKVSVDVQSGTPFKMGPDSPASLFLQPGQTGTVTLTVQDNNGNPVPNTVVPVQVYSYGSTSLNNLWLTGVNGITLQQNESQGNGNGVAQEPTPIPMFTFSNTSNSAMAYSSITVPGVASWNSNNASVSNLTTNSNGQIELTLTAGNASYWATGTSGNQVTSSGLAASGQSLNVTFQSPAGTTPYQVELVPSSATFPGPVKGTINY